MTTLTMLALVSLLALAQAQRPGPQPGGGPATCAFGSEGETLPLACSSGGEITGVVFADYGQVTRTHPNSCCPFIIPRRENTVMHTSVDLCRQ